MPSKVELVREIYLLLAACHLNDLVMSPEMAQKIFDRWPAVIPDRPETPEDIVESYNAILQQIPEQTLATQAPKTSHSQQIVKNENKKGVTPESSRFEKPIKPSSSSRIEDTPKPPQSQKPIKNENTPEPSRVSKVIQGGSKNEEDTPSPFSLVNHSIRSVDPKPKLELAPKSEATTSSRVLKLEESITCKKEPPTLPYSATKSSSTTKPSSSTKKSFITTTTKNSFITKRTFVDLTNDTSSDDEDDTPSKKPRMR